MQRIVWLEPEGIHCVENTDTITYHAIRIELKNGNNLVDSPK
jgi:hypothetical protein